MGDDVSFSVIMNVKRFLILALVMLNFAFLLEIFKKSKEIEKLSRANADLASRYEECENKLPEPSMKYEKFRRSIFHTINSFHDYLNENLKMLEQKCDDADLISNLTSLQYDYKIKILSDWKQMTLNDGYEKWRTEEVRSLTNLVQIRFNKVQRLKSCRNQKILNCILKKGCSWGCQIQQYQECFAVAYGMGRILKFSKSPATFYGKNEFNDNFLPISRCSTRTQQNDTLTLPSSNEKTLRDIDPPIKFLPPTVPKEFSLRAEKLYGDPSAWWAGQITRFLLSPGTRIFEDAITQLTMKKPIVAIVYRKKDKIDISTYMDQVDEFFDNLDLSQEVDHRRIYVSTDVPSIIAEISKNYSEYKVYSHPTSIKENTDPVKHRKDPKGPLIDTFLIAWCDFIIGNFSNSLMRRAYELSHLTGSDTSERIKSFDDSYQEYGREQFKVIMDHQAANSQEITADLFDLVDAVDSKKLNGFRNVINPKTRLKGLIPSFKLEKITRYEEFHDYSERKKKIK